MLNYYLAAEQLELVIVTGPDAERFLQGQVSCDVSTAAAGNFLYGTACNNKGRIIAPFLLMRREAGFHLVFSRGLGALFIEALNKYLPFYKCTMAQDAGDWRLTGLLGSAPELHGVTATAPGSRSSLGQGWLATLATEPGMYLACLPVPGDSDLVDALVGDREKDAGARWRIRQMQLGHFPFSTDDSGRYTPQELGYDRSGYVSFTKGCYTGQEIVARLHYRGKLKRQLFLVRFPHDAHEPPQETVLMDAAGNAAATCLKVECESPDACIGLAILPVDATTDSYRTERGRSVTLSPLQH